MLMPQSRVRFIGSRELHRDLPKVLESLENQDARFVLTIHSKPKAVLIGAEAFLALLRGHSVEDRLLALQLGALVQGLESGGSTEEEEPAVSPRQTNGELVGV
jgi:PHD/YefM family antitoxin component YafN of YafNO toxin-antitoxin module